MGMEAEAWNPSSQELRQEDVKFESIPDYIGNSKPPGLQSETLSQYKTKQKKQKKMSDMAIHAYNPSAWEVEAGESGICHSQPGIQRSCLKNKNKKRGDTFSATRLRPFCVPSRTEGSHHSGTGGRRHRTCGERGCG